jgi:hypothetical protein
VAIPYGYLRDRTFQVRIHGQLSQHHKISAGVPQGSALSPLLYAFFTADILPNRRRLHRRRAKDGRFADDLLAWSANRDPLEAQRAVQLEVDFVADWCARWRHEINAAKSACMGFSRRLHPYMPHLTAANLRIPAVTSFTYLGVTFECRLQWTAHVNRIAGKIEQRLNGLKAICRRSLAFRSRTRITVYKVMMRTVMEYGVVAWAAAPDTLFNRLQRLQNDALRTALRLPVETPLPLLHALADVTPVKEHLMHRCATYAAAAMSTRPVVGELLARHRGRLHSAYLQQKAPLAAFEALMPEGPVWRPSP